jgi:RND family efflux transporter MFP subunit
VSNDSTEKPGEEERADGSRPTGGVRRSWRRWAVLAALAAGVAVLFVWEPGGESSRMVEKRPDKRATMVSVAAVERGALTERATYSGELDADAADLASGVSGRLEAVHVRIGDAVDKGQELARVDAAELVRTRAEAVAATRAARAAEQRAQVEVQASEHEVARAEALLASGTISAQEMDQLRARANALAAARESAAAQQAQAQARVGLLDQQIADSRIRAPFSGTVAARHFDPGTFVSAGTSVIRLVARTPLRVRFDVPEQDVGRFRADTAFAVRAPPTGSHEATGHVTGLGTEVDRTRRVVRVEGVVDEPPASWLPGMFAEVVAAQRTIENATVVPAAALVSRLAEDNNVQTGVFRPTDGVARWVPVRVLARDGDRVAIEPLAGALAPGEQVLVGGYADLADGAPITFENPASPERPD